MAQPEVDQAALGQQDDAVAVGKGELIDLRFDLNALDPAVAYQFGDLDFDVEVADVADDHAVLHPLHLVDANDVAAPRRRNEDIALGDGVVHLLDLVAFHRRLQGADRINLGDDHPRPQAPHGGGAPLADIAVASYHHDLAGDHYVGGALDAVGQRLATAVEVVELALGDAVVDVDRRHGERPGLEHLIEVMDASSRLLGDATETRQKLWVLLVDPLGQVAAVVEDQVRAGAIGPAQGLFGAPPVLVFGLALPGEDGHARSRHGSRGVVLGREMLHEHQRTCARVR